MGHSKSLYLECCSIINLMWLSSAAIRARGLHGPRINAYTTRDTANQAFVDAYMASRVSAYPAPAL
jgi:hypothetical protein